jgi:hypothetical protein
VTIHCGRGAGGALWLVHGWRVNGGGEAAQTGTISCGKALPLVGGSGSCLGVLPHDVNRVISRDIYSGLYLGRVSLDVPHSDAFVLTLFDGVARGTMAVDLHFFTGSYNGSVTLLLL